MGSTGAAPAGAAGSPSPDPAPCPGGGAEPWARLVPPHAAVLEGTWSPSSFGLCCEVPTVVPREMALAAMGGTWGAWGGTGSGTWPWWLRKPCATGGTGVTTPCPATTGTCHTCAWTCLGHGAASHTQTSMDCLCPAPHLPAPRSSSCRQKHPLPGHGQGHAVTLQRPCLSLPAHEPPGGPAASGSAEHRTPSLGTVASPRGETPEAGCCPLSLGRAEHPASLLAAG